MKKGQKECTIDEIKQSISNRFSKFSDKDVNAAFFLYDQIKGTDRDLGTQLFEHICLIYEDSALSHEDDAVPVITREEVSNLSDCYDGIIEAKFKSLLSRKYDEKTFYEKMWYFIWKSDSFSDVDEDLLLKTEEVMPEDKVRAYVLYEILRDKRIPYYCFSAGLSMSNDDFRQKCEDLLDVKRKIRFILFSGIFDQKTEKASQLVRIVDSLKTFEQKTIAMVFIVGELQKTQGEGELAKMLSFLQRAL